MKRITIAVQGGPVALGKAGCQSALGVGIILLIRHVLSSNTLSKLCTVFHLNIYFIPMRCKRKLKSRQVITQ